jgi:hypothetical protein
MSTRNRSKAKAPVSSTTLIHEINEKGFHRIVRITDGKSQFGEWAAHAAIAKLDSFRAATSVFADDLPQGIFTTTAKPFVSL